MNTYMILFNYTEQGIRTVLPDDATMAKLALSLGAVGNVRTLTMRAFPEPEYRAILASL